MGTINKVNKRTKVNALAQTPLQGWTDTDEDPVDLEYLELDDFVDLQYHEKCETFEISFECNDLPHCCGIFEFGELNISGNFPLKQFKELFSNIIENDPGKTFMINTNGRDDSKIFETLLSKTNLFTPVKKFKSGNSGNIITIWISNGSAL